MGRHLVAVFNLHITYAQTMKVDYSRFSLGGLPGKHVVATWKGKNGNHPSICSRTQENQEKPVSRWPVAGPSVYWLLASHPASKASRKNKLNAVR
jgi:hypothetical protein